MSINSLKESVKKKPLKRGDIAAIVAGTAMVIVLLLERQNTVDPLEHYNNGGFLTVTPKDFTGFQSQMCMVNKENSELIADQFISTSSSQCDNVILEARVSETSVPKAQEYLEFSEILEHFFDGGDLEFTGETWGNVWDTKQNNTNSQIIAYGEDKDRLTLVHQNGFTQPLRNFQISR